MGAILGENLYKITVERGVLQRGMKIRNTPEILEVKKASVGVGTESKPVAVVKFNFKTLYGENSGKVEIEGELYYMDDEKVLDQLDKEWKADKAIKNDNTRVLLMNRILETAFLKAIIFSEQVKLPPPILMPRIEAGNKIKEQSPKKEKK
jgi:hypothetical protein